MKTIGQIYVFPTCCFLVYPTKDTSFAAHTLSYAKKINEYTPLKNQNTSRQNNLKFAKLLAEYWSHRLSVKIFYTQHSQPVMLLNQIPFEDRIYCQILTDEKVGWISYNGEDDLPFFTENSKTRK